MADPVIHPDAAAAHIAWLLDREVVVALTGDRIGTRMPPKDVIPQWPAIRVTVIDAPVVQDHRWVRALVQFDCWADRQLAANQLAALVTGHLTQATGAVVLEGTAVLGGPEPGTLATRPAPDTTVTPDQPRAIVTGQLWIRPNP